MDYRVLAMDIDGTLVCRERPTVTPALRRAVQELRARGVATVLATGRMGSASAPAVLGLEADYRVCVNGACILDGAGRALYEDCFTPAQVEALWSLCRENGYALSFSFNDFNYAYVDYPGFFAYYRRNTGDATCLKNGEDGTRHLHSLPYGAFARVPDAVMENFCREHPDFTCAPYESGAYDVFKAGANKATGLERLLRCLGRAWGETVALGDGLNDRELLSRAGLGIAMGNAPPALKAAAHWVTEDCLADGAALAICRAFGV